MSLKDFKVGIEQAESILVGKKRQVYLDTQANTGAIFLETGCDYMLHYNATHYGLWQINYMPLS